MQFVRVHSLAVTALMCAPALARQQWLHVEEAKLLGSDTNPSDALGRAVAIDGDTAVIGAPKADPNERGAAYVFVRSNGGWTQQAKLVASLGTVTDFDHFGASVAIEGDTVMVGAPDWGGTNTGQIYAFQRSGTAWTATQNIGGMFPSSYDGFGTAVALSGTTLAVSAPWRGIFNEGAIAIYEQLGGSWQFRTWIPSAYQDDDGHMGDNIALEQNSPTSYTLITTTYLDWAEVYEGSGTTWSYLTSIGPANQTLLIDDVAVFGSTLVVGSSYASVGAHTYAGQVGVYVKAGTSVTQQAVLQSSDPGNSDRFGYAIALDGDTLVIGEPFDGDAFAPDRGAVFVYERVGTNWNLRSKLTTSDPGPSDRFGSSLDLDGASMIGGAPEDSNALGLFAGAAYAVRIGFPTLTYCTAGVSVNGCVATMSSTGTASASLATPFSLQVANVDGQRAGIVFYGVDGPNAIGWSASSFLCVKSPVQRTPAQLSGGTIGACDGSLVVDWNLFASQHPSALGQPFGAGHEISTQAWYRDPLSAKTTELSNALVFALQP